jgi:hypothetical protein
MNWWTVIFETKGNNEMFWIAETVKNQTNCEGLFWQELSKWLILSWLEIGFVELLIDGKSYC